MSTGKETTPCRCGTSGRAAMRTAVRAGAIYFALVFAAGFALGTLRTLVLAPRVGDLAAVALELPAMLAISWVACGWVLWRRPLPADLPVRATMGGVALALLLAGEIAISIGLAGRSPAQHFALYQTPAVMLGLCGQLAFAIFPLVRNR